MSSASEQGPLNPNDPEYYAPPWLRERAKSRPSLTQEARSEAISSPIFLPAELDIQRNPLAEVIHEPAALVRELDRRRDGFSIAARFAAAAAVVMVGVLLFVIMKPASRQSDVGSTSSDITGSISPALPQSDQGDIGSKPALAEFQALVGSKPAIAEFQSLLASVPASQPATHEQSQQLLQQFLQWRKKPNTTEPSR